MGQRPESAPISGLRWESDDVRQLSIFPTEIGWCGLWGSAAGVEGLSIGHIGQREVRAAVQVAISGGTPDGNVDVTDDVLPEEADWNPQLRGMVQDYCQGHPVDFSEVDVRQPPQTPFQRAVIAATRQLGWGETVSYGELAARAGYPRAARAVGTVMSSNRFPLIIPCHRVVAASGRLGGYSAPQGVELKVHLLAMEAGEHSALELAAGS